MGEVDRLFTGSLPTPDLGEPGAHPSVTCPRRDPQAQVAHGPRRAAREGPGGQGGTQAEPTPSVPAADPGSRVHLRPGVCGALQLVSHMGNGTRPSSGAFVTCQLLARPLPHA